MKIKKLGLKEEKRRFYQRTNSGKKGFEEAADAERDNIKAGIQTRLK